MVTIKDVAKVANVSIATVSRVINGYDNVDEKTRKKVLKAIRELGYKPRTHYALNGALLRTVGVLMPDLGGYHYGEILTGIEEYCFEKNFDVMVSLTRSLPDVEKEVLDQYFKRKVDGILVCTLAGEEKLLERFLNSGVTIVAIDSKIDELRVDSVNVDNFNGAYHAMKYLYEKRHRRILYIPGPQNSHAAVEREKAIETFAIRHKVKVIISEERGFQPETGYSAVKNYLKKRGKDFTAIFCVNDYVALGALNALNDAGINVPEEVSIMGFDDSPFASYTIPPLTTVSQPRWLMGKLGAELLLDKLNNPFKSSFRTIALPAQIVERKSVKAL